MNITLSDVIEDTATLYHLKLHAGEKGLQNPMRWVYVTEDPENASFLRGGELVITTGLFAKNNSSFLLSMANNFFSHGACGLIINTGKYVKELPKSLLDFCNEKNFPLLTMPWESSIYRITRNYYDRLFVKRQMSMEISAAVSDLIAGYQVQDNLAKLERNRFSTKSQWFVFHIICKDSKHTLEHLQFMIENFMVRRHLNCHCQILHSSLLLLLEEAEKCNEEDLISQLTSFLQTTNSGNFHIGIGEKVCIEQLQTAYFQSQLSANVAIAKKQVYMRYDDLGFYRILFAADDPSLLQSFVDEELGTIILYDKKNNSNYLMTLRLFLFNNGGIKSISEELFCHRNTINYRLQILKNNFHLDLDNSLVRFHLIVAFFIKDYLEITSNN